MLEGGHKQTQKARMPVSVFTTWPTSITANTQSYFSTVNAEKQFSIQGSNTDTKRENRDRERPIINLLQLAQRGRENKKKNEISHFVDLASCRGKTD